MAAHHLHPVPPGDDIDGRTPPHDIDIEQAIIGAAMYDSGALYLAREHLGDGTAFYRPAHETIWRTICHLVDADNTPDPLSVAAHLTTTGEITRVGGHDYIHTCYAAASPPSVVHHALIIVAHAAQRARIEHASRLARAAWTLPPEDYDRYEAERRTELGAASNGHGGPEYVDWGHLLAAEAIPTRWHASPLLAAGRVTLLYSPGKSGKSLIAQEVAAARALGRAVLDTPAGPPQHVLYIDQEMTPEDWLDRISDMGYGPADAARLTEYLHLAQLQAWPPLDTAAGGIAVAEAARSVGADIVIIDTVSKVVAGEENANDTHTALYQHTLVPLKRLGMSVLILDHTGKDLEKGARGGTSKTDNVDLAFELLIRGRDLLSLRCSHARFRDDALREPVMLRRESEPLRHVVEQRPAPSNTPGAVRPTHLMERVCVYVEGNPGVSRKSIETAVKGRREYVRLAVELLLQEGYMVATKGAHNAEEHRVVNPYREGSDRAA